MAYCRSCGMQISDDAKFCLSCGTPTQAVQPAVVYVQPVKKPKVPGRGMGIASLALSGCGLPLAPIILLICLVNIGYYDLLLSVLMLVYSIVFSAPSFIALPFALSAKKRGFVSGITKAGYAMSIVGMILWGITMLVSIICLAGC